MAKKFHEVVMTPFGRIRAPLSERIDFFFLALFLLLIDKWRVLIFLKCFAGPIIVTEKIKKEKMKVS